MLWSLKWSFRPLHLEYPTNLNITAQFTKILTNFREEALSCDLFWGWPRGFPPRVGLGNFAKTEIKMSIFSLLGCPYFSGQGNLLGGQFWVMGRFNLLGRQNNLLGGQMPTQLTCYLPPCCKHRCAHGRCHVTFIKYPMSANWSIS